MKTDDILLVGAAVLAAAWMLRRSVPAAPGVAQGASLVREWLGWRYYDDGTVIDPFGAYWHNGVKVWDPITGAA